MYDLTFFVHFFLVRFFTSHKMAVKGVLLDNVGRCSLFIIMFTYIILYGILVIVGSTGPPPILYSANAAGDPKQICSDPNACTVWWTGVLTDMTPQHQLLWVNMELERPFERVTQRPALASIPLQFSVLYTIDVLGITKDGKETSIVSNSSHAVDISCPPGALTCAPALIFTETMIKYPTYRVITRFINPYAAFSSAPIDSTVKMHFSMGYISQAYTQFEIGVKLFFVVCGSMIFIMYTALLFCGPGVKDDNGQRLSSTYEQRYIWWLGFFCIFFNNPFLIIEMEEPSLILAGFNAFCVITFLTSLLTYWLVQFDLARMQGEQGFEFHIDPSFTKLGLCFWLPKIIFAAIFWTISLAAYMWQRIMQLNDPAYSIAESFPLVSEWFGTFISGIVIMYLLYFFALFVLTMRHWRTIRPTNKLVIALTLFTLILSAVGIFLNAFTAIRSDSILILAAYSAPNLYIWFLQLAFIPGPRLSTWVQHALEHDQGHDARYRYPTTGNRFDQMTTDTSGVMGNTTNDDVQPEDVGVDIMEEEDEEQQQPYYNQNAKNNYRNQQRAVYQTQSVQRTQAVSPRQTQASRTQYPPQSSRSSINNRDFNDVPVAKTVPMTTRGGRRSMNSTTVTQTRKPVPTQSRRNVAVNDVIDDEEQHDYYPEEQDGHQDEEQGYNDEYTDEQLHAYHDSQSFSVGEVDDDEAYHQSTVPVQQQQQYNNTDDNEEYYEESTQPASNEYIPDTNEQTINQPNNVSKIKSSKPNGPRPNTGRKNRGNLSNLGRPGNPFADSTGKNK